jgi:lipopolysaccharide transport system ATP-binding protein
MSAVNALCESAILLRREGDQYTYQTGTPKEIAKVYLRDLYSEKAGSFTDESGAISDSISNVEPESEDALSSRKSKSRKQYLLAKVPPVTYHASAFRRDGESFGLGGAQIESVFFRDVDSNTVTEFHSDEEVSLVVRASVKKDMAYPSIGFVLKDSKGQKLIAEGTDSYLRDQAIKVKAGAEVEVVFKMRFPSLIRGEYPIDVAFAEGPGNEHVQHHLMHDVLVVTALGTNLVHGTFGAPFLSVAFDVN